MPKFQNSNGTFWVIFKHCVMHKNWHTLNLSEMKVVKQQYIIRSSSRPSFNPDLKRKTIIFLVERSTGKQLFRHMCTVRQNRPSSLILHFFKEVRPFEMILAHCDIVASFFFYGILNFSLGNFFNKKTSKICRDQKKRLLS